MKYSTLFLLLIILQYNLFGQNEYHTFSGYVLDEAGYSTLACLTFTGLDRTVCCNSEGFFRIDSIPTGTHDLQISSLGYSRIKTKITIREDMKRKFTMFPAIAYYNIKQTEEFEDYHEKLEESAGDLPVMEFVIDSLKEDRELSISILLLEIIVIIQSIYLKRRNVSGLLSLRFSILPATW